jgi:hypothetical protein
MTLRPPIQLAPGSCSCSTDRTTCACLPADYERMSGELRDARYRIDATDDPVEKAKLLAEHARLGRQMTAAMQYRNVEAAHEARSDSADIEERAFDLLERCRGVTMTTVDELRDELRDKSDAYRRTRLDGILADEPALKHKAFCRDVARAADRAEGRHEHRYGAKARGEHRYDAIDAARLPATKWPPGFDRAKAISVLEAAGFNPLGMRNDKGNPYQPLSVASEAWLLGALQQVLDTLALRSSAEDMLIKLGYRAVDGYWQFGGGPLKTPAPKSAPAGRVDAGEKQYSHRDSWKRPLAVVTEDDDA